MKISGLAPYSRNFRIRFKYYSMTIILVDTDKIRCLLVNPNLINWSDVSDEAMLGIEVGYALTALVDERKDAPLMKRVTGIRKQLSKELGFVIPLVRIKDDLTLDPNAYRITIGGTVIGEDVIWPAYAELLDYEMEFGFFIGKAGRDIPLENAREHIFGYSIFKEKVALAEGSVIC